MGESFQRQSAFISSQANSHCTDEWEIQSASMGMFFADTQKSNVSQTSSGRPFTSLTLW